VRIQTTSDGRSGTRPRRVVVRLTRGRCRLERPELDRRVQTLGRLVLPSRIYPCSVCSAEKRRLFFEQLTYSMTVISIQSQVAYGHVGNSAAVFPMQMRGIDVIVVPTTLLSNRPGYPTIRGRILDADLVADLLAGIEERGAIDSCQIVLSGYLGSPQIAGVVMEFVTRAKKNNPKLIYCCDPVLGDSDPGLFVDAELPPIFRDSLCPLADIITPNHFKLEWLCGAKAATIDEVIKTARALSARGPSTVVVTGAQLADTPEDRVDTFSIEGSSVWRAEHAEASDTPIRDRRPVLVALGLLARSWIGCTRCIGGRGIGHLCCP
jgi:pyridoxine kinase